MHLEPPVFVHRWLNTVDPLKRSRKSAKLGLCFNTKRFQTGLCQLSRKQTKSHKGKRFKFFFLHLLWLFLAILGETFVT